MSLRPAFVMVGDGDTERSTKVPLGAAAIKSFLAPWQMKAETFSLEIRDVLASDQQSLQREVILKHGVT